MRLTRRGVQAAAQAFESAFLSASKTRCFRPGTQKHPNARNLANSGAAGVHFGAEGMAPSAES